MWVELRRQELENCDGGKPSIGGKIWDWFRGLFG